MLLASTAASCEPGGYTEPITERFFFLRCFLVTLVNSELVTMSPPSSASSLYASSLNSLGSRSRGGLEAMESSLVEEMEGREQGPADTCPESLELGADTGTVFTLSRIAGAGAGPGEDALS